MASGCPFVTTLVGGTPEIIAPASRNECIGSQIANTTGAAQRIEFEQRIDTTHCQPDNPDEMASLARYYISHPQVRTATASAMRRLAEARFDVNSSAAQLKYLYQNLLTRTI
jgi:glycosyltransferase involved in cell wall biosynthesis